MKLVFHGDIDQIIDTLTDITQPIIMKQINKYIANDINNKLNDITSQLQFDLYKHNVFDIDLIDLYIGLIQQYNNNNNAIQLYNNYIDIQLATQFIPNIHNNTYDNTAIHHTLSDIYPLYNNTIKSISTYIDEYFINSFLYSIINTEYNILQLNSSNLPSIIADYMNTASFSSIIPELNEIYTDRPLTIYIKPIQTILPSIQFKDYGLYSEIPLSVSLTVLDSNNIIISLVLYYVIFNTTIDSIHIQQYNNTYNETQQKVVGNMTSLNFDISVIEQQQFDFTNLTNTITTFMPDFLHTMVLTTFNEELHDGIEIPNNVVPYIQLINTELLFSNGVLNMGTDFKIHIF